MSDFLSFVGDQVSQAGDWLFQDGGKNLLNLGNDAAKVFTTGTAKTVGLSTQGIINSSVEKAINARDNARTDDSFHSTQVASKRPAPVEGQNTGEIFKGKTSDPWMSSMRYVLNMNKNIAGSGGTQ